MARKERTRAYRSWECMKARCNNPANNRYQYYGAKGISYDPRWEIYANFLADMGEAGLSDTLDRIDRTKGYSLQNCRWASYQTQSQNRGLSKANTSGVRGVSFIQKVQSWQATGKRYGVSKNLYLGKDFFLAICARKSWENRYNYGGVL